jgi:hypothetical protein
MVNHSGVMSKPANDGKNAATTTATERVDNASRLRDYARPRDYCCKNRRIRKRACVRAMAARTLWE